MNTALLIPHTLQVPAGFPPQVRRALSGREVAFDLPRQVRLRMRHPEKIRVSEWAEKYRVVTDGAHEGPWRHEYAPHTVKIMDTFGLAWVREVWFCGVEQSCKTNTMINCIGWCVDCDPGNIFYLMPTEDTAAKITGGKLKPTLTKSPRLARYLSGRQDDTTLARINLTHGVTIFPAHANSASSMATWAAKHCFGDEVDKYPAMAGKEADPITLIKKRNRTYKGRFKRFFASTPAGLFVHKGMQNCHQVWEYRLKCPHCGDYVRMDAEHLVLPPGAESSTPTPEEVERLGAAYECNACGELWDDAAREAAIRSGRWHCVKGADVARPAKVGFHHRAWECLDIPLAEIAAAWLRAKAGGLAEKVAWANGYEAVDYAEEYQSRKEDSILRLIDPHMPRGVVPRGVNSLLVLADTQQTGFYYEVRAFGWGRDLETWVIDHGYVERFEHLDRIACRDWHDADGNLYRCRAGFIDSGGGTDPAHPKHSRTREVYDFCIDNAFWSPLKGAQRQSSLVSWTRLDFFPGKDGQRIAIPGGLLLYRLDTTQYKNIVERKLLIDPGNPGACHLHAGLTAEEMETWRGPHSAQEEGRIRWMDYARQMCAEYKDERGLWQCLKGRANHHFDLAVYAYAAADILMLGDEKPEEPEKQQAEAKPQRPETHTQQRSRRW